MDLVTCCAAYFLAIPLLPVLPLPVAIFTQWMHIAGCLVLDVRTPAEWDAGHISCAHRLAVQDTPPGWQDKVLELANNDLGARVVTYCRKGVRSSRANSLLRQLGFSWVANGGGYEDQKAELEAVCAACVAGNQSVVDGAVDDIQFNVQWYYLWYWWVIIGVLLALVVMLCCILRRKSRRDRLLECVADCVVQS